MDFFVIMELSQLINYWVLWDFIQKDPYGYSILKLVKALNIISSVFDPV